MKQARVFLIVTAFIFQVASPEMITTERRVFRVITSGRDVGTYEQIITHNPDSGVTTCRCSSRVSIDIPLYHYHYSYAGIERWQHGRLVYLVSETNDDGAVRKANIKADNQHQWSTSYWFPAKPGPVQLVDADTSQVYTAKVEFVGNDQIGHHYRVTGGISADLWFDDKDRLVRRDMLRRGRATSLQLVKR
jgi:hypothetical protein